MITLTFETTEFNCLPDDENTTNEFMIFDNSLVIKTIAAEGEVLTQTEIEMENAVKLAKILLV